MRRIAKAPFLQRVPANELGSKVRPQPLPATLEGPAPEGFSPAYGDDLAATGDRVTVFGTIVEEPATDTDRLRRSLFYGEAAAINRRALQVAVELAA